MGSRRTGPRWLLSRTARVPVPLPLHSPKKSEQKATLDRLGVSPAVRAVAAAAVDVGG
jgi:hypothetical protein